MRGEGERLPAGGLAVRPFWPFTDKLEDSHLDPNLGFLHRISRRQNIILTKT